MENNTLDIKALKSAVVSVERAISNELNRQNLIDSDCKVVCYMMIDENGQPKYECTILCES